MIYSTLLLLFGIYIGQEYPVVPSVRLMSISLLRYIKERNDELQKETTDVQNERTIENFSNFIKSLLYKRD
jgi:hypothetical protein